MYALSPLLLVWAVVWRLMCDRPAAQLARLPTPLNASKAKKRNEMLGALEKLDAQLDATFRALGRALAQRGEGVGGKDHQQETKML